MPKKWIKINKPKNGYQFKQITYHVSKIKGILEEAYFQPFLIKRGFYNDDY
jgi:hypothetical protein